MSDETPPETISPDDLQSLAHAVKGAEFANAALNSYVGHLHQKYQIAAPDQLRSDGAIVRAPKPAAPVPPVVGSRAARRREKFSKS